MSTEQVDISEWIAERELLLQNPPMEGDFLRTIDGSQIKLEVLCLPNVFPLVFARAYLPQRIGESLSWYVRSVADRATFGTKCIVLPASLDVIMRKGGLSQDVFLVKELRVVRPSKSKKSFLVEVSEWE